MKFDASDVTVSDVASTAQAYVVLPVFFHVFGRFCWEMVGISRVYR